MNRGTRSMLVNDLIDLHNAVDSNVVRYIEWEHEEHYGDNPFYALWQFTSRKELYLLCVQARSMLVSSVMLRCVGGESAQAERLENAILSAQDEFQLAVKRAVERDLRG